MNIINRLNTIQFDNILIGDTFIYPQTKHKYLKIAEADKVSRYTAFDLDACEQCEFDKLSLVIPTHKTLSSQLETSFDDLEIGDGFLDREQNLLIKVGGELATDLSNWRSCTISNPFYKVTPVDLSLDVSIKWLD